LNGYEGRLDENCLNTKWERKYMARERRLDWRLGEVT
jgi:hypothetical protein